MKVEYLLQSFKENKVVQIKRLHVEYQFQFRKKNNEVMFEFIGIVGDDFLLVHDSFY